ncbi:MAG TPA: FxsA family protein [Bacillales bacterium]|nr:FxsA family protein [Bacillales bacterium]
MKYLPLFFIVVSAAEIGLFILSGNLIGVWATLALIVLTGILGASMAKKQGSEVLKAARMQLRHGQVPGEALLDGICILIGAVLLITPGFLSDTCGFLLLVPKTREYGKAAMQKWIKKMIRNGTIYLFIRK